MPVDLSNDQTNAWRETARGIFDELHFGEQSVFNNDLAKRIVAMIEERHHDFFCVGHPITKE